MQVEFTGIAATLKGNHTIILTATAPDGVEKQVKVPCEDIRDIYGVNCPQWMEENGDRESSLWELWQAVAGIGMEENGDRESSLWELWQAVAGIGMAYAD